MINDLLASVSLSRSKAQDLRRKARKEVDPEVRGELFASAAQEFQKSITELERGLRTVRRQQIGYTSDVCRILEALSPTCGSLGGTWRDAGKRELAELQYDKGAKYEKERRDHCGAKDTYNMLQLLVIRLLLDPSRIDDEKFKQDLNEVRTEIQTQIDNGRNDSWGFADLALARFLCGVNADDVIQDLEQKKAESNFYESTYNAIAALVDEGLGKGKPLGERLEAFKRLLQRKGGFL